MNPALAYVLAVLLVPMAFSLVLLVQALFEGGPSSPPKD
jgi:hypothetical protein